MLTTMKVVALHQRLKAYLVGKHQLSKMLTYYQCETVLEVMASILGMTHDELHEKIDAAPLHVHVPPPDPRQMALFQ